MSIEDDQQLEAMRRIGRIVRQALVEMRERIVPGVTTRELDQVAERVFDEHGARSAPRKVYDFPGATCISVNDEIVHGVPGSRTIAEGDVVKIDVTAEKDGYFADSARTVLVGDVTEEIRNLAECVRVAFDRATTVARVGHCVSDIGRSIHQTAKEYGLSVVPELTGHGIGRTIHEAPTIPNYFDPRYRHPLTEGLVVAVEPILAAGTGRTLTCSDGWTIRTADGRPAAHHEHTLVITDGEPILLTAA